MIVELNGKKSENLISDENYLKLICPNGVIYYMSQSELNGLLSESKPLDLSDAVWKRFYFDRGLLGDIKIFPFEEDTNE